MPLNAGLAAQKAGQPATLSLNRPKFAAELLHLLLARVGNQKGRFSFSDGTALLRQLGYQFWYSLDDEEAESSEKR